MTSTNDKLRSLILAALMVMSVFAGTVAFSGSAAAANSADNLFISNPADGEVEEGSTVTHETVAFDLTGLNEDNSGQTVTVTISFSNAEVVDASGVNANISSSNQQVTNNGNYQFTLSPSSQDTDANVSISDLEVAYDANTAGSSSTINLDVADSGGDDLNLDVTSLSIVSATGDGTDLSDDTLVYAGQDAFFNTDLDGTQNQDVRLVRVDGDDDTTVRGLRVSDSGLIQVETEDLETDTYAIEDLNDRDNNNDNTILTFEVIVQTMDTEFNVSSVDDDENASLEVSSNRVEDFNVTVDADGASNDRLLDIFNERDAFENDDDEIEFTTTDGDEFDTDFTDVNRGDYQFNFSVVDTTAEASADITVEKAGSAELDLNESSYTVETGDTTNMTITFDETDEGFIRIGDDDIGYNTTYEVVDGDEDGMLNVSFNSYNTSETDGGLSLAEGEDGEVDVADDDFDQTSVPGALDAGNYDIEVTQQSEDLGDAPDAVGTLAITERSTTSAQPWVTHSDALDDISNGDDVIAAIEAGDVTQRRNVAEGDFAVIQFQVSGIYGYLENNDGDLAGAFSDVDTSDVDSPVSLQVEEASPGPNQEPDAYDLSDLTYVLDDERNMLFVVVPTSGSDSPAEDGDTFNATLEVNAVDNDDFSLNDANTDERVSANFRVTEREAPLNTNAEDLVEIGQSEDGEVTGTTTIAPGSEITVRVRSVSGAENPFVMSETVNVSSDGTYNATFDFADTPVGTNFTASVSGAGDLAGDTDFDGVVVEADADPTESPTPTDTPTPTETPEDGTDTPTPTETPEDGDTPTETDDTTTTTTPGFGAVVAVLALLGAALLALRRD